MIPFTRKIGGRPAAVLYKRDKMRKPVGKARGLLRASVGEGTFSHHRLAPDEDLAPFVEHFWSVSWRGVHQPLVREVLPHPSVHVVFERGRSGVQGVPRGRFTRILEGDGIVLGIKFRPGCFRPFVPFPVSRLTGRRMSVRDAFGDDPEESILTQPDVESMIVVASDFLRERLPARNAVAEEVAAIVQRIMSDLAIRRVEDLALTTGRSTRALQRLFSEFVGVSPKWVIRRYRLLEAIERVNEGEVVDWTTLALDLGYFDQAHFIRDFKSLVGRTPASYARLS